MITLIDLFFIVFFINLLLSLYIIYTFIQFKLTHSGQGSKLKIKLRKE